MSGRAADEPAAPARASRLLPRAPTRLIYGAPNS